MNQQSDYEGEIGRMILIPESSLDMTTIEKLYVKQSYIAKRPEVAFLRLTM